MIRYFCAGCATTFQNENDIDNHPCDKAFKMKEGYVTVGLNKILNPKRSRWSRFKDIFFELDITYYLALLGIVTVNAILISHINLTFTESFMEAFGIGCAIPRLLK